ncbi:MAG: hypothetical protein AUJ20_11150 [Comamonadaceae bacterium CG1_02_60_18]|nr:MAG: hypothetical protein AUJ20_11150 [Comamonadaceae bacterium CG1_02_60_18]PIQ52881.1 MAG: hypothetical protein COW02_08920 [Comamonadaceae bacterium CG12_big_fil_rev_8_21_14_0_65_59_15]
MGFWALLDHIINLLAPAFWLALLLPVMSRLLIKKSPVALTYKTQAVVMLVVGCAVLVAGLVLLGRDAKMLTYLALVLVLATLQWWWQRGRSPRGRR